MLNRRILILGILGIVASAAVAARTLQIKVPLGQQASGRRACMDVRGFIDAYPYASPRFDQFVMESYSYHCSKQWRGFYDRMDRAYKTHRSHFIGWKNAHLKGMLDSESSRLYAIAGKSELARAELALSANLHRFIKMAIPTFSLDRGFEFYYTHKRGERQCFLQSILIAGMLQRAGVNAGVVMVYKNINGEESNNGHAVNLVRLSNGRDIIVDASEPKPFAKHKGLFIRQTAYAYVDPVFGPCSDEILHFKSASNGKSIERARVNALDYDFLRSQFWYYRGERAIGGLILLPKTKAGLKASEQALRMSVKICPKNPLAVFTLGRVYMAEGKMRHARKVIADARKLYAQSGWMPAGIKEYLALAGILATT